MAGEHAFVGALSVSADDAPMSAVTLAVRPEHLTVSEGGGGPSAVVQFVEPLGPETLVHLKLSNGEEGIARLSGARTFRMGTSLHLSVDPAHALLHDEAGRLVWRGRHQACAPR